MLCMQLSFRLSAASRQDVPSFGEESCVCMYVCVHAHCVCNSRAVKMFHLSAASCQDVMFWQRCHVLAVSCQDIHFSVRKVMFYSLCICIVFHAVKMFQCVNRHLSAAEEVLFYFVLVNIHVCMYSINNTCSVKIRMECL